MAKDFSDRRRGRWKECTIILAVVTIGLAVAFTVVVVMKNKELAAKAVPPCATGQQNIVLSESENPSIFSDLTQKELSAVGKYLHEKRDLNLVKIEQATVNSSYIYYIELLEPNKSLALKHLDGKEAMPARWAKAVIFRGDLPKPQVEEYQIGPLPTPTSHKLIDYMGRRKNPIPFEYRPITFTEFAAVEEYIMIEVQRIARPLLLESFGASIADCGGKCLTYYITPVATSNYGRITRNIWFWLNHAVEYFSMHPLDFQLLVQLDGADVTKYKVTKVWYNQKIFESIEDLVTAYNSGSVDKLKIPFPQDDENLFSSLNLRGDAFPKDDLRRPIQLEPDGKRYTVKGQHIEYLGWSFDYRMSTTSGPMIFDVRFKGERIAYEISLQEIAVYYSANNPANRFCDFIDSAALVGVLSKVLVPGADCPNQATYLPARHLTESSDEPFVYENALCLFEQDTGVPLRRHHSYNPHSGNFYGGMMDDVLILRTILTVVNYDYIFDFIFHQSGAVEVRAISTGYILPSFYSRDEDKYGFRIHENIIGTVHHHMFNFKVDIDIQGTQNRFETLDIGLEEVDNSMFLNNPSAEASKYPQINFQRNVKASEKVAAYKFKFESPKYLLFHNNQVKGKYDVPRSYRVAINGMSKQTLPQDRGHESSVSWSRYQMAVTKRHETELRSSSLYAMWDSFDPVLSFQSFIDDDESIVDQDLVAWITLGVHHIPHTEDLPVTPTVGGHLQFFLLPYNYFTEDPSMASRNAVRMDLKQKEETPDKGQPKVNINHYGIPTEARCVAKPSDFDSRVEKDTKLIFSTGSGFT